MFRFKRIIFLVTCDEMCKNIFTVYGSKQNNEPWCGVLLNIYVDTYTFSKILIIKIEDTFICIQLF